MKNGLRFPIFGLLGEVVSHYGLSIAQVYPIGICRLIAFEIASKRVGAKSSLTLLRQFYQMKGMGRMFFFLSWPKGKDFLWANADLSSGWRMRYIMVRAANFPAGMGWRRLRGEDRCLIVGFFVQDVRRLEDIEPLDLTEVTSAMLEKEGLWKRLEEGVMPGEVLASWDAGEGNILLIMLK